jgi:hypothetical protein
MKIFSRFPSIPFCCKDVHIVLADIQEGFLFGASDYANQQPKIDCWLISPHSFALMTMLMMMILRKNAFLNYHFLKSQMWNHMCVLPIWIYEIHQHTDTILQPKLHPAIRRNQAMRGNEKDFFKFTFQLFDSRSSNVVWHFEKRMGKDICLEEIVAHVVLRLSLLWEGKKAGKCKKEEEDESNFRSLLRGWSQLQGVNWTTGVDR